MLKLLSKWILKTVSEIHKVVVGLILVAFATPIVIYAKSILIQIIKTLNQPLPLWVTVVTILGVLLTCRLFLKKILTDHKIENKKMQLDSKATEMLRTIAAIENPLKTQDNMTINQQFLAETLKLSPQKTKYYLEQLNEHGLIIYTLYGDLLGLTSEGRTHLNNNGIIP